MEPNTNEQELNKGLQERFSQLPKVVQDAILSADVQKHLQSLSEEHKLHLDQWQLLENNVMLSLLGFQPVEELAKNIQNDLDIPEEAAQALAADISRIVFEPIRAELERELEHPEAKAEDVSDVESARAGILEKAHADDAPPPLSPAPSAPAPIVATPATPPPPPPSAKAERFPASGPASGAYKPGETSATRKIVEDDPYREPPA